ncbi:MAG: DUF2063 domain-containing protein [Halieaceae bacterium]|nr:DUF2063 domain-containing protein [Halieaceae bacterium]
MKSAQLVRLQHQFLSSLHKGPTDWLLEQIQPVPGFANAEEVLSIYLHRAMARTIDPLHSVYRSINWMVGDEPLENLLEFFYSQSIGEPLNSQVLAADFASFLDKLDASDLRRLSLGVRLDADCGISQSQALTAAGMLDWRRHWVSLANRYHNSSTEQLHKKLHHRSFISLRPRLDGSSRLCVSGVDLVAMCKLVDDKAPAQAVPICQNEPGTFLIHADSDHNVTVRQLEKHDARLLNHCDGTHTIASLCHEASFFGRSHEDTRTLIGTLLDDGVIASLHDELV